MLYGLFPLICGGLLDGTLAAEYNTHHAVDAAPKIINYPLTEGFVEASGVMIYYTSVGRGPPLLIVYGGPGGSHDYFFLNRS